MIRMLFSPWPSLCQYSHLPCRFPLNNSIFLLFSRSLHQAGVMGSVDERILNYFQWLKEIVQSNSRPFLSQHLMYIAACVYSKQRDQLNTMFSELLRIKVNSIYIFQLACLDHNSTTTS